MKHGNLSSNLSPAIGVRFEHVVYNFGKVNQPGKAFLERLLSQDINLYLFTLLPERRVKAWCWKWHVMYTAVLVAESTLEIPELCRAHHLLLYIDTDDRVLQSVTERGAPRIQVQKWEQKIEEE